ncbi:MAG: putative ubiquitin carboxyl-terminal hydrolase 2 isoform X1 [Hyperionvirus sp.]|uniref:Putative ubiquitin carboxyl-terminal hydrolase 2 isoform X1 n=1 Tax=Hyperionvirus sp. TaxID=2487770 RepID=A0A3G5A996_9VIRU|nr:MAG: putative ubiquitin carboxyl-terminal hydrolase 2 isoform X1 [Hyperionvirus sp.]
MKNRGIVGLRNLGNTCYMNAALQCLRCIVPLSNYIFQRGNGIGKDVKHPLVSSYFQFVKTMWSLDNGIVSPSDIRDQFEKYRKEFVGGSQQDAQEFTNYLLDAIHEAIKVSGVSIISELFFGKYKSTVICDRCDYNSVTYENYMFLTLPIAQNLNESMKLFAQNDMLNNDNRYRCEKCKVLSNARKKMRVYSFPRVLIIYLKRFSNRRKIDDFMEVPLYFSRDEEERYELVGVIEHFGSVGGGHYTANGKIGGKWYAFNDSSVNEIEKGQVVTRNAYVLFYEKQ